MTNAKPIPKVPIRQPIHWNEQIPVPPRDCGGFRARSGAPRDSFLQVAVGSFPVTQALVSPLQGLALTHVLPRALPWAGLGCPFGAHGAGVFSDAPTGHGQIFLYGAAFILNDSFRTVPGQAGIPSPFVMAHDASAPICAAASARLVSPLRGLAFTHVLPRALPWAGLGCPFGANGAGVSRYRAWRQSRVTVLGGDAVKRHRKPRGTRARHSTAYPGRNDVERQWASE